MKYFILILSGMISASCAFASLANTTDEESYSWTFTRQLSKKPRGGTSIGTPVELDKTIPAAWNRLREPNLTNYERDRRAIYAMEGEYETRFEFLESFLLDTDKELDHPYASWGTEFVKVIEDTGNFISLQHIMVMFYKDPDTGEVQGPHVMKHWRQDFHWQGNTMLEYQGDKVWQLTALNSNRVQGKWVWHVYQVDDSPRYSGVGTWKHFPSASTFSTEYMSRPLPRRERTVRSDYKVLLGKDTLVVAPTAWYHEQRSFKHVNTLTDNGSIDASPFASREIGHNSYKRIKNFEFSKGFEYWERTKSYWADVRGVWRQITRDHAKFKLRGSVDRKPLFVYHFEQAEDPEVLSMSSEERQTLIRTTIDKFIVQ